MAYEGVDYPYWDGMVQQFLKDKSVQQISNDLAGLIKYYANNWQPENIYVCEEILKNIKLRTQ